MRQPAYQQINNLMDDVEEYRTSEALPRRLRKLVKYLRNVGILPKSEVTVLGNGAEGVVFKALRNKVVKVTYSSYEANCAKYLIKHPTKYMPRCYGAWRLPKSTGYGNSLYAVVRENLVNIVVYNDWLLEDCTIVENKEYYREYEDSLLKHRSPNIRKFRNSCIKLARAGWKLGDMGNDNIGRKKSGEVVPRDLGFCEPPKRYTQNVMYRRLKTKRK